MYALLIHPFSSQALFLQKGLKDKGVHSDICTQLPDIKKQILKQKYQLLIIKHFPPEFDAVSLAEQISPLFQKKIPIIILNDQRDKEFEIKVRKKGFKHIVNPPYYTLFQNRLIKKLRLKNKKIPKNTLLKTKDLILNIETHKVHRKGKFIPLRHKEFSLLEFFLINKGKVINRPTILEYVWDRNANIFTNTIDVHVRNLRKKIDDGFKNKLIKTIPCTGYKIE